EIEKRIRRLRLYECVELLRWFLLQNPCRRAGDVLRSDDDGVDVSQGAGLIQLVEIVAARRCEHDSRGDVLSLRRHCQAFDRISGNGRIQTFRGDAEGFEGSVKAGPFDDILRVSLDIRHWILVSVNAVAHRERQPGSLRRRKRIDRGRWQISLANLKDQRNHRWRRSRHISRRADAESAFLRRIGRGVDVSATVREQIRQGRKLSVAAGGDGTISSVVQALVNSEAVLGVLPLGTYNHFARDLGIPLDWREALSVALTGTVRQVD